MSGIFDCTSSVCLFSSGGAASRAGGVSFFGGAIGGVEPPPQPPLPHPGFGVELLEIITELTHGIGNDDIPPEVIIIEAVLIPVVVYIFCTRDMPPEIPSVPNQL